MARHGRTRREEVEERERALTPHRKEEQQAAAMETEARLRHRGVALRGDESLDELGELRSAVEEFEAAVEARGGDLMVDDLNSSEPEHPEFVLPEREGGEPVARYVERIDRATERLWEESG